MTYFQAIIIGLLQGVTELFPISSLGHSVLLPSLFGWDNIVRSQTAQESFFLAFLVGLHCATAIALIVFYRAEWLKLVRAFLVTLHTRKISSPAEKLIWLIIAATIPVGIFGLVFEHVLRTLFAKPLAAAVFLTVNGLILFFGERLRRRAEKKRQLSSLSVTDATLIGSAQILALFAGISRSGSTMVAGLMRGLDHEEAAHFSFLLATPIILAAGLYKLPDLFGHNGDGVRGQIIVGSIVAGLAAYVSIRFLSRYFQSKTLLPFAIYSLVVGVLMILRFA